MDYRVLPDVMVFLEVVRAGSISRAARRLNTVQSNVTTRMQILEDAVGTPLLKRHARGVKPTAAGEAALAMALKLDAVMDDLRLTFGPDRKPDTVKLRLGAIETVAARHLPSLIAEFVRSRGYVDVSVQTGSSASLLKQLREGDLDVVFLSRRPNIAGLREGRAFEDDLVLLAPLTTTSMSALIASRGAPLKILVQRLGCSYTERLLTLAREAQRDYRLLEIGTLDGIVALVEAGVGVAVMPALFAQGATASRTTKHFPLPREHRKVATYFVAPARADSSKVVNEFVDAVCLRAVRKK